MPDNPWYYEGQVHQWLVKEKPMLAACSGWITEQLNLAFSKGHQIGFGEGEHKQAMLELAGRDKFIADLRKQFEMTGRI